MPGWVPKLGRKSEIVYEGSKARQLSPQPAQKCEVETVASCLPSPTDSTLTESSAHLAILTEKSSSRCVTILSTLVFGFEILGFLVPTAVWVHPSF